MLLIYIFLITRGTDHLKIVICHSCFLFWEAPISLTHVLIGSFVLLVFNFGNSLWNSGSYLPVLSTDFLPFCGLFVCFADNFFCYTEILKFPIVPYVDSRAKLLKLCSGSSCLLQYLQRSLWFSLEVSAFWVLRPLIFVQVKDSHLVSSFCRGMDIQTASIICWIGYYFPTACFFHLCQKLGNHRIPGLEFFLILVFKYVTAIGCFNKIDSFRK